LIREFKLFSILDNAQSEPEVTSIHNDDGYRYVRQALSNQIPLADTRDQVLKHLRRLWGFWSDWKPSTPRAR
jgi:stage V sporulation protein R